MRNFISKIWKPDQYHGHGKKDNFFEGWFFKSVDKSGENIIAVIPGVFVSRDPVLQHAFIQILEGNSHASFYVRYPFESFSTLKNKFEVRIGNSIFSRDQILLDITNKNVSLKGELKFSRILPWPVTLTSPGIMGWYSFVPFMECNHGVLSLDHKIEGKLNFNGNQIDFSGGKGYIEKDWGSSFPSSYVWCQSNHFEKEGVSFTGSIAKIPWLFSSFRGFIVGLLHDGKLHRFTTYTGAKVNYLKIFKKEILVEIEDKNYLLKVRIERTEGGVLHGPYEKQMLERVSESLNAKINLKFCDKNGKIIFEGNGIHSGLDVNGKLEEIADEIE